MTIDAAAEKLPEAPEATALNKLITPTEMRASATAAAPASIQNMNAPAEDAQEELAKQQTLSSICNAQNPCM